MKGTPEDAIFRGFSYIREIKQLYFSGSVVQYTKLCRAVHGYQQEVPIWLKISSTSLRSRRTVTS